MKQLQSVYHVRIARSTIFRHHFAKLIAVDDDLFTIVCVFEQVNV